MSSLSLETLKQKQNAIRALEGILFLCREFSRSAMKGVHSRETQRGLHQQTVFKITSHVLNPFCHLSPSSGLHTVTVSLHVHGPNPSQSSSSQVNGLCCDLGLFIA